MTSEQTSRGAVQAAEPAAASTTDAAAAPDRSAGRRPWLLRPPGPHSVLRNRNFVRLWAGESVSLIGTQVTQFALPLVAVITLSASVFQVGLLNACRYAPVAVISLFAGVFLDRHHRRPILLVCSLCNAVLVGLIPLAYALGILSMGLLYTVYLLIGVVTVIFDIGVLSFVPTVVGRDKLGEANGRIQTSTAVAGICGPGLGGALVGALSAPVTLVVDAASYLCSALGLSSLHVAEPAPTPPADRPSVRASIAEGLRAVFGSRFLRALLGQSAMFNLFQNALVTVFVVYAVRDLHMTAARLGVITGAISVGGLLGAMFANKLRSLIGFGRLMRTATICAALCPLILLIPRNATLPAMLIFIVAQLVYGFNLLAFNVNTLTLRQVITPHHVLGRMNASYRMVLFGAGPLGAVLGGLLGASVGLRAALVITAIVLTSPILWTVLSPVYRLEHMPTGPLDQLDATGASGPAATASR